MKELNKSHGEIIEKIHAVGGVITTAQLNSNGINKYEISEMTKNGVLDRVMRGVYQLPEIGDGREQLVLACKIVASGIVCLLSALDYHGLTTFNPREIALAIPRSAWAPKLPDYPPLKLVYFSETIYSLGVTTITHNCGVFRVYDAEKTVCDVFRYRKKLGQDIAIEALREYLRRKDRDIEKILDYARVLRIERALRPIMEAIL